MVRPVQNFCRKAERLRRLEVALRCALWGGAAGAILGAVWIGAARTLGLGGPLGLGGGADIDTRFGVQFAVTIIAAAGLSFCVAFVVALRPLGRVAVALDEHYGLKTTISTALAMAPIAAADGAGSEFAQAIIRGATERIGALRPGSVVRWRLKRPGGALVLGVIALAAMAFYFPHYDVLGRSIAREKVEAQTRVRKSEARRLEELARELKPKTPAPLAAMPLDVSRELDRLADSLRRPDMERADAMLKVSDVKEKIERERQKLRQDRPKVQAEIVRELATEAARELARALLTRQYGRAAKAAEAMARDVREGATSEAENAELGADLEKLAGAIEGNPAVSGKLAQAGGNLSRGLPRAGAQRLDELADTLGDLERAEAMAGELARATEALERAQRALGRGGQAESRGGRSAQGRQGAQGDKNSSNRGASGNQGKGGAGGESGKSGSEGGQSGSQAGQGQDQAGSQGGGAQGQAGERGSGQSGSQAAGSQGADSQSGGGSDSGANSGSEGSSGGESGSSGSQGGSPQSPNSGGQQGGEQDQSQGGGWGEVPPNSLGEGAGSQGGAQGSGGGQGQSGGGQSGGGQSSGGGQGSAGGGASGQGGSESGQGSGQGSGRGSSSGSGQGSGNDWGVGSTNLDGGRFGGDGGGSFGGRQSSAPKARWEEQFMRLYAEKSIQARTINSRVTGTQGEGEDIGWRNVEAKVKHEALSAQTSELFLETQSREKQSLDHQDIPLDYKDAVRRYFDSIEVPSP